MLVCSYYRQWALPRELNFPNSDSKQNQINRYKIFGTQVSRALGTNNCVLILTDDNIDTILDHNKTNYPYNSELKQLHQDMMVKNILTCHNNKPTFLEITMQNHA